jgi:hypothetical protein
MTRGHERQRGQASIELVAAIPVILLIGAIAWQLALAGHAAWLAANAARAGARADLVGRDPEAAARSALPRTLERGLELKRRDGGGVSVALEVPLIGDWAGPPLRVSAASSLGARP